MPFLEKAWAKAMGNYETIYEGGTPSEVLDFVTGAPTITYETSKYDKETLWQMMN
jgi:hypothetical protein